jgi:tetratricopeptide (TPR) repeat protein
LYYKFDRYFDGYWDACLKRDELLFLLGQPADTIYDIQESDELLLKISMNAESISYAINNSVNMYIETIKRVVDDFKLPDNIAEHYYELAELNKIKGLYKDSIHDYSTAIILDPSNKKYIIMRWSLYKYLGLKRKATEDLQRINELLNIETSND